MRFAQGHLVLTDDGEWAVCVDEVSGPLIAANGRQRLPRRRLASELEEEQVIEEADVEAEAVEVEDEAPVQETAVARGAGRRRPSREAREPRHRDRRRGSP